MKALRTHPFLTLPGRRRAREEIASAYEESAGSIERRLRERRDKLSTLDDHLETISRLRTRRLKVAQEFGLSPRERLVLPSREAKKTPTRVREVVLEKIWTALPEKLGQVFSSMVEGRGGRVRTPGRFRALAHLYIFLKPTLDSWAARSRVRSKQRGRGLGD